MEFPGEERVAAWIDPPALPEFTRLKYDPLQPVIADIPDATARAIAELGITLPRGATVAVCVGSRGIRDIETIVSSVIERLLEMGLAPVVIPAMGSHGGATAAGQRATLAELGITEERMGVPIDDRMDTTVIGETEIDGAAMPVHIASAALEADAVLAINRVKPHTGFSGPIESGVAKMLVVGLGKQPGARMVHRFATASTFQAVIEAVFPLLERELALLGGIAIVENAQDRTAHITAIDGEAVLAVEPRVLEQARQYFPMLPFAELDLLIVDALGKDVSGTGMDTNVIGRADPVIASAVSGPSIDRIYVRSLTDETHGNANGVGLADIIHRNVVEEIDLRATYANTVTSGALANARLPVVLPSDRAAISVALESIGYTDPDELAIAWIQDTATLDQLRVSNPLRDEVQSAAFDVAAREQLRFIDGTAQFDVI